MREELPRLADTVYRRAFSMLVLLVALGLAGCNSGIDEGEGPMARSKVVLSCEEIRSLNQEFLDGMVRVEPAPDPRPGASQNDRQVCVWEYPDKSPGVVIGINDYPLKQAQIDNLKSGTDLGPYVGDTPGYQIVSDDRLNSINAVGVIPLNGPSAIMHTTKYRIKCVGLAGDTAFEVVTRIAEHLVHQDR